MNKKKRIEKREEVLLSDFRENISKMSGNITAAGKYLLKAARAYAAADYPNRKKMEECPEIKQLKWIRSDFFSKFLLVASGNWIPEMILLPHNSIPALKYIELMPAEKQKQFLAGGATGLVKIWNPRTKSAEEKPCDELTSLEAKFALDGGEKTPEVQRGLYEQWEEQQRRDRMQLAPIVPEKTEEYDPKTDGVKMLMSRGNWECVPCSRLKAALNEWQRGHDQMRGITK